jgi:shikimate 5-dehydrogenase
LSENPLRRKGFRHIGGKIVYDIVVAHNTPLIQDSRAAGCLTFDGNDMIASQTKILIEALTGVTQPESVIEISKSAGVKTLTNI